MLDTEFLTTVPQIAGLVVYRYRSGILRTKVRNVIAIQGFPTSAYQSIEPNRLAAYIYESRLYDPAHLMVCDIDEAQADDFLSAQWELILQSLVNGADQRILLALPMETHLMESQTWQAVAKACLVIDEIEITRDTSRAALRYLEASTDLGAKPSFLDQPGFIESFDALLDERPTLMELMFAFDDRVLTCTDPVTNRYDPSQHQLETLTERSRASPQQRLRALISNRNGWDLVALVTVLDDRRSKRGWTGIEIIRTLYGLTGKVLSAPLMGSSQQMNGVQHGSRQFTSGTTHDLTSVLWTVVLLAWEERFLDTADRTDHWLRPSCDLIIAIIDQVGRDFLRRTKVDVRLDPCCDLDQAISRIHKRLDQKGDPLASARKRLVVELLAAMAHWAQNPHALWVKRLYDRLQSTPSAEEATVPIREVKVECSSSRLPQSFDTILGHSKIVSQLSRRLREANEGTGLILHGPSGVGKRTLARLYAKSLMCKTPLSSGFSCDRCDVCREFARGAKPFGFVQVETSQLSDDDQVQYTVDLANKPNLASELVFLIPDVDTFTSGVFDKLLKSVEAAKASYILTVVDLSKVRLAIQSRSVTIRLRPLTFQQSREQLAIRLAALKIEWEEKELDLLAAYTAGLPGAITKIVDWVATLTNHDLEFLRSALGSGWVHDAASYWQQVFEDNRNTTVSNVPNISAERDLSVNHLQAFLYHIRMTLSASPSVSKDAAFLHYNTEASETVADLLARRAQKTGRTSERLWSELAGLWAGLDGGDAEDLYRAEYDTKSIINGRNRFIS